MTNYFGGDNIKISVKSVKPFEIDKSRAGFCARAAWVVTENINGIKLEKESG